MMYYQFVLSKVDRPPFRQTLKPSRVIGLAEPCLEAVMLTSDSESIAHPSAVLEAGFFYWRYSAKLPGPRITLWPQHPDWLAYLTRRKEAGAKIENWHWEFVPVPIFATHQWTGEWKEVKLD